MTGSANYAHNFKAMKYKRLNPEVEAKVFPDNGPEQHLVAGWIRSNGAKAHLYDGAVENDVKTSTEANWRWRNIDVEGSCKFANVGDYIVREGEFFSVYTKNEFNARFILCA